VKVGHGGFKVQVQQRTIQIRQEMAKRSHGKDGNKGRFPLSHGTAAAIYLNLFTKFVALGI